MKGWSRDEQESGSAPLELWAEDYGARPDGVSDSGPGIRAALAAAISSGGPAVVRLGRGRYRVECADGDSAAIRIVGAHRLWLAGEGDETEIVIGNPRAGGIEVTDAGEVGVRSLSVDYDPLPYTQGTVLETDFDTGSFVYRVDDGYRQPSERYFHEAEARFGIVVRDAEGPEPRYGPHPLLDLVWESAGSGVWRVRVSNPDTLAASRMGPGDRFVHMARRHSESAINFWRTDRAAVKDVTVYAGPSLASIWGQNVDVDIDGLRVEVLPGSNRLLSANGDGIHNLNTRGRLRITNCSFAGMADDAINIHVRAGSVSGVSAPDRLDIAGGLFEARPGDMLQLYDPRTGRIRAEVKVRQAVRGADGIWAVVLEEAIERPNVGIGLYGADQVYNLSACGCGFVICGNRFGRHRGRGILVRSLDGIIRDNEFANAEGWAIAVQHEPDWPEGPLTRNLTITGNTFEGAADNVMATVHIAANRPEGSFGEVWGRPITGIKIEDNRFIRSTYPLVHVQSATEISVCGNVVDAVVSGPQAAVPAISEVNAGLIDADEGWSGSGGGRVMGIASDPDAVNEKGRL